MVDDRALDGRVKIDFVFVEHGLASRSVLKQRVVRKPVTLRKRERLSVQLNLRRKLKSQRIFALRLFEYIVRHVFIFKVLPFFTEIFERRFISAHENVEHKSFCGKVRRGHVPIASRKAELLI